MSDVINMQDVYSLYGLGSILDNELLICINILIFMSCDNKQINFTLLYITCIAKGTIYKE